MRRGVENMAVRIIEEEPGDFQFEISRADGKIVILSKNSKLVAAQIVAIAFKREVDVWLSDDKVDPGYHDFRKEK